MISILTPNQFSVFLHIQLRNSHVILVRFNVFCHDIVNTNSLAADVSNCMLSRNLKFVLRKSLFLFLYSVFFGQDKSPGVIRSFILYCICIKICLKITIFLQNTLHTKQEMCILSRFCANCQNCRLYIPGILRLFHQYQKIPLPSCR